MEGDLATAELMARLYIDRLQFSFSPFPVVHPAHEHGIAPKGHSFMTSTLEEGRGKSDKIREVA